MFEVSSDFKSKDIGTNAEISFKSVGPGYVSLGAPNIRQDIQSIKFKVSQPFDNKKIMASVYYKLDKNNIAKLNPTTSTSTGLGFNLKINYKEFPFLIIDYRRIQFPMKELMAVRLLKINPMFFINDGY
ncbi:MAG: hypothetical protein IPG09_15750 [Ignavibacteria bacterium]|nr:hypothetical protein [Ignavibacteria bacterium]